MQGRGPLRRAIRAAGALFAAVLVMATSAAAHDLSYALTNVSFPSPTQVRIEIRAHIPALILGHPQGPLTDPSLLTFMALDDAALRRREAIATANFLSEFSLRADGRLIDAITVHYPDMASLRADAQAPKSTPRPSQPVILTAPLTPGTRAIDLALPQDLGPAVVVVSYGDGRTATEPLPDGERSRPIRLGGPSPLADGWRAFTDFVADGFRHILPGGYDHVLFIVALAIAAPRLGALVKLATVFTLAHSVTLALGVFRLVELQATIVEPAIALSIVAVGVFTLISPQAASRPERLAIIFAFGLLHGLGFAGALRETGLPRGLESVALAGFNIGIELGQLAVIAVTLACIGWWRDRPSYRSRIAMPVSAAIALAGSIWTVQRIADALGAGRTAGF